MGTYTLLPVTQQNVNGVGCGPSFPFKWRILAADIAESFLFYGHISGPDIYTIPPVTNSPENQICRFRRFLKAGASTVWLF